MFASLVRLIRKLIIYYDDLYGGTPNWFFEVVDAKGEFASEILEYVSKMRAPIVPDWSMLVNFWLRLECSSSELTIRNSGVCLKDTYSKPIYSIQMPNDDGSNGRSPVPISKRSAKSTAEDLSKRNRERSRSAHSKPVQRTEKGTKQATQLAQPSPSIKTSNAQTTKGSSVKGSQQAATKRIIKPSSSNVKPPITNTGHSEKFDIRGRDRMTLDNGDYDYWIKGRNSYYQTLKNPAKTMGVKIPDDETSQSCAFSLVSPRNITVEPSGVAGVILGYSGTLASPRAGLIPEDIFVGIDGNNTDKFALGFTTYQDSTTISLFSQSLTAGEGSDAIIQTAWSVDDPAVPGTFDQVRLVSMGMSFESTAAVTDQKGFFIAASLPRQFLDNVSLNAISANLIENFPGAIRVPLNTGKGVTVTYNPTDNQSFEYVRTDLSEHDILSQPGILIIVAVGCEPGTEMLCTIVANYEGIPKSNNLSFVQSEASIADPDALADAMNRRSVDEFAEEGTEGINGLKSSAHPMYESTVHANRVGSLAIHDGPFTMMKTGKGKSNYSMRPHTKSKGRTLLSQLASTVLPIVKAVAPALLAAI